jgi:hypothetical protein
VSSDERRDSVASAEGKRDEKFRNGIRLSVDTKEGEGISEFCVGRRAWPERLAVCLSLSRMTVQASKTR